MTTLDNFIVRWARLKHGSNAEQGTDNNRAPVGPVIASQGTASSHRQTAGVQPRAAPAADEIFDPSSLPSVEAITAETDIRGFLQSRVPLELTIAALRQAWSRDSTIRDFIGIAENQWDFNDPNSMPGFGPLEVACNEPAGFTQVLGTFEKLAETSTQLSKSEVPATAQKEAVELAPAGSSTYCSSDQELKTVVAAERSTLADDHDRVRRRHGSALPQ